MNILGIAHYDIKDIFIRTNSLSEPEIIPNFFDQNFLNELMVKNAINKAIDEKAFVNFRIWLNGNEESSNAALLLKKIEAEDNLESWGDKVFHGKKYCILISRLEQFADDICASLSLFLSPILEDIGNSFSGNTITVLLGNYGFTPAGIHRDPGENSIFHFNLGPNEKEILIWDRKDFLESTGSEEAYKYPEKIRHISRNFCLKPNDLFILPPNEYHIGFTPKFAVDVVAVISNDSNKKITELVYNSLIEDNLARCINDYEIDRIKCVEPDDYQSSIQHVAINKLLKNNTFESVLKKQLQDLYFSKRSNAWWSFPPTLSEIETSNLLAKKIQLNYPFPILIYANENQLKIFMRGRELITKLDPTVVDLVEKINTNIVLPVEALVQEFSEKGLKSEFVVEFIQAAIQYKSIRIIA